MPSKSYQNPARRKRRLTLPILGILLGGLLRMAMAGTPAVPDTAALFAQADRVKMIDNASYVALITQLQQRQATLSDADQWHLLYLEAWQTAYVGQNEKARPILQNVAAHAPDEDLREQARATLVNILGLGHRYQEAFANLDQALEELPRITRVSTRQHVLGEAAQLLDAAGQYELAMTYADQLAAIPAQSDYACLGLSIKLDSEFRQSPHDDALLARLREGVATCLANHNMISADTLRADIASLLIDQGKPGHAIALLQGDYAGMAKLHYQDLVCRYDVLLAQAYWKQNDAAEAEKYALTATDIGAKSDFAEPLISAYQLLYQIARQNGDLHGALVYHEKFMQADDAHLDDMHEKALAYQVAKQQMDAKKAELDELGKQNRILQLQQAVDHKEMETSRLSIALLITVLLSVALWLYRLKRSQMRFMRMASLDGLTDIFNRQHFVDAAEQVLRTAAKSQRNACLVLIDLDHFKSINDTHGHTEGDRVLKRTAAACRQQLRAADLFGRLGGEEFGVLLPGCSAETAIERAEQLRRAIQAAVDEDSPEPAISASLGIASTSHHGYTLRGLLLAADDALYRAKRDGRNRVVINLGG